MADSTSIAKQTYLTLLSQIGRSGVSALYPNDFETYLSTLELVDSENKTVESFIFPINPDSLSEVNNNIINIQKTNKGISILKTNSFIPVDISLSGTFGRRFKFLIGKGAVDAAAVSIAANFNSDSTEPKEFNSQIKTGFGCTKVLERILKKTNTLDSKGNPHRLFFYNQAFGTSYMVEYMNCSFKMDMGTNMLWHYEVALKAIAPLTGSQTSDVKKITTMLSMVTLMKGANSSTKLLNGEIKKQQNIRAQG